MYVVPGIGAVPALFQRIGTRAATLPAQTLPKPYPVTGITVTRPVTVTRSGSAGAVVTPASRFLSTPTPVRAPAPTILKPPATRTALRPSLPTLRTTALEMVGRMRPPAVAAVATPSSPFSMVTPALRPTVGPTPGSQLARMRAEAAQAKTIRPGSILARLREKAADDRRPIAPDSMLGRLLARATPEATSGAVEADYTVAPAAPEYDLTPAAGPGPTSAVTTLPPENGGDPAAAQPAPAFPSWILPAVGIGLALFGGSR